MNLFFTKWFRNSENKPTDEEGTSPCAQKRGDCLKIIQYIMDGEATSEQEKHFEDHILECMPCFEQYNLDKCIKSAIQTKICKMEVPAGLVRSIKSKIDELA